MADLRLMLRLDALDKATKPLRNLQGAIRDTSKAAADQRKRFEELQKTINNAPSTPAQFKQMQEMRKEMEKTNKAILLHERHLKQLTRTRNARTSGKQMMMNGSMRVMAAMGAGYGVARFLSNPMKFDATMSKVQALAKLEKNDSQTKALRDQAKYLNKTTWATAQQVADAQVFYAMTGYKPDQILKALPSTLDVAKAGDINTGRAADITSNILSAFDLSADETERVANTLVAVFTRSNVTMEMLGDTMKYAAPLAETLNISVEEAAAMSGILGSAGIQGGQSGRAMAQIYKRLAAPTKAAFGAMEDIGLKATDKDGNLKAVPQLLAEIIEKTQKMGNAERLGILRNLAGDIAAPSLAVMVKESKYKDFTNLFEAAINAHKNRESDAVARIMEDNLDNDINLLAASWSSFQLAVFEANNGGLRDTVQYLKKIMDVISDFTERNPELVKNLSKIAGGAIAITAAIGGITMALGFLKFAVIGHPIVAILTTAVFLGMLLYDNFDAFMDMWTNSKSLRVASYISGIVAGLYIVVGLIFKFKALFASAALVKAGGIFMKMATGMKALNFAFLASPVFWALALIAGLIYMVYKNWDSLVWLWNEGFDSFQKSIGNLLNEVPGIGGALKFVWDAIIEGLKAISSPLRLIYDLFTDWDNTILRISGHIDDLIMNLKRLSGDLFGRQDIELTRQVYQSNKVLEKSGLTMDEYHKLGENAKMQIINADNIVPMNDPSQMAYQERLRMQMGDEAYNKMRANQPTNQTNNNTFQIHITAPSGNAEMIKQAVMQGINGSMNNSAKLGDLT